MPSCQAGAAPAFYDKGTELFGEGDYREMEFAGATFDPSGRWLFVKALTPGIAFAITGPWERGLL